MSSFAMLRMTLKILIDYSRLLNQILTIHFGRLWQAEDVEDRWSHIGQPTFFYLGILVRCNLNKRNLSQRVSGIH